MTDTSKTYATRKAAAKGAKNSGWAEDKIEIVEVAGGKFMWMPKDDLTAASETEEAEVLTMTDEERADAAEAEAVVAAAGQDDEMAEYFDAMDPSAAPATEDEAEVAEYFDAMEAGLAAREAPTEEAEAAEEAPAEEAEAADDAAPEAPADETKDEDEYNITLSFSVTRATAREVAKWLARKHQVVVRVGFDGDWPPGYTVNPEDRRTTRSSGTRRAAATREPGGETQEGRYAPAMIELARRPQGVTRAELERVVCDKKLAWTTMLKRAAERHGFRYVSNVGPDRRTTYWLVGQDEQDPAAAHDGWADTVATAIEEMAAA